MVTSALAGEGKTFCSLNLALSIASEVDSSVLLVDADVVRPSVMSRLGLQGRFKGLLDLLSDTSLELPDLILKTNVPKLACCPRGRRASTPPSCWPVTRWRSCSMTSPPAIRTAS